MVECLPFLYHINTVFEKFYAPKTILPWNFILINFVHPSTVHTVPNVYLYEKLPFITQFRVSYIWNWENLAYGDAPLFSHYSK